MAAKFFTGLPLDGPDPECVLGRGEQALAGAGATVPPKPSLDHSRGTRAVTAGPVAAPAAAPVPVALLPAHLTPTPTPTRPPDRPCDESPLAGAGHGG
jgi:hypothetical protein